MKTLISKRNSAIRIIAPKIVLSANKEQYWIAGIPQTARTYLAKEWTLVEEKPKKVYRVENEKEQRGLWRRFDGTWAPLFDMLTDGQCKDMPMEDNPIYREGGKQWFASAPSKETLQKWFSKRDLEELTAKGFTITEFEVIGYKKISDFEYIFTRDNIISRTYLKVSDIYPQEQPEVDLEKKVEIDDLLEEYTKMSEKHMQDQNNPDMYSFWDGFGFCAELISLKIEREKPVDLEKKPEKLTWEDAQRLWIISKQIMNELDSAKDTFPKWSSSSREMFEEILKRFYDKKEE